MNKILQLTLAGLSLVTVPLAHAWTYQDEQAVLVFRKPGFNDVVFNIGSVSNFLNKPNGYSTTVTGWNLGRVTSVFGSDLTADVRVIVLATTSSSSANRRAWLSSADLNTPVYDQTPSVWQGQLYGKINAIGTKPLGYDASATNTYEIAPTHISAYDYIVSDAGVNTANLPKLGGTVPFKVESPIAATLKFWEIKPSSVNPKPASSLVGTFTLDATGVLSFSVGSVATLTPASITSITRAGGISTVNFTTGTNGNYSLLYSSSPVSSLATWSTVAGPISGDGAPHQLTHTTAGGTGFYSIKTSP